MTGDTVVNPDAAVIVMTTEVLRNMIYARSASLERLAVGHPRRGPLPAEPVPRRGVGRGDHPPARHRRPRVPLGDGEQRRRRRRLDRHGARRHRRHHRRDAAGRTRTHVSGRRSATPIARTCCRPSSTASPIATPPDSTTARRRTRHPRDGAGGRCSRRDASKWRMCWQSTRCSRRCTSSSVARGATRRCASASTPGCGSPTRRNANRSVPRRRPVGGSERLRPRRPRLRPVARGSGDGRRRPPRRSGPTDERGGRGAVRRRAGQAGVRHRDVVAGHQHAGALGGDREADQVHRRPSRDAHGGGVHAVHRSRRAPGARRRRLRRRAVVALCVLRAGGGARRAPHVRAAVVVPAYVQHGGQPHPSLRARRGAASPELELRPVPRRPSDRAARGGHRTAGARHRQGVRASGVRAG